MKLAYLTAYFPSLTETFIYREVVEIRAKGIDVSTYSLRRPDPASISRESMPLFSTTYYLLPVRLPVLLRDHLTFFLSGPRGYVTTLLKMVLGTHKRPRDRLRSIMHFGEGVVMASRLRRDGVDHIHAHFASQAASVARVASMLTGIPYSFTAHAHDIWHDQILLPQKVSEASFVVCCTDFGRRYLSRQLVAPMTNKIHVVYHGIDVTKFTPPNGSGRRVKNQILSVGALGETKGFPDLIDACAVLRERGFHFECVIIGEGPERTRLESHIARLNLGNQVRLIGSVKQEAIIDHYRRAWVFALPCIVLKDGRGDNLPNVLIEAMAAGLPVVTTATRGQSELVEHAINGLVVPPRSPTDLADAIRLLCEDEQMRTRIILNGRKRVEDSFDNRNNALQLLDLFERNRPDRQDVLPGRRP